MSRRLVFAVAGAVALLAACKKAPPPDCEGAGAAVARAAEEMAAHAQDAVGRETAARLGPAAGATVTSRCKQDHWSAKATDCIKAAKGGSLTPCEATLTAQQNEALKLQGPPMDALAAAARGCGDVMRNMTKFWEDRAAAAASQQERDAAKTMASVASMRIGKHCAQDSWSDEAIACFKSVEHGDFASCERQLTKAQIGKLRDDAPAMSSESTSPVPMPPTPAGGSAQPPPER